jgi:hypothetical protein
MDVVSCGVVAVAASDTSMPVRAWPAVMVTGVAVARLMWFRYHCGAKSVVSPCGSICSRVRARGEVRDRVDTVVRRDARRTTLWRP